VTVGHPHQYVEISVALPMADVRKGIEIQMYLVPAGFAIPHPRFESSGRPVEMSP
jgi:hypothetical protein